MKVIYWILLLLLIIGGLNWGMVGAFDFNLVTYLFGAGTPITIYIYSAIGLAAIIMILMKIGKCIFCHAPPAQKCDL